MLRWSMSSAYDMIKPTFAKKASRNPASQIRAKGGLASGQFPIDGFKLKLTLAYSYVRAWGMQGYTSNR